MDGRAKVERENSAREEGDDVFDVEQRGFESGWTFVDGRRAQDAEHGKTSASSVDDEEDDGEDNAARSGSKCDYRDWNAITRSPILKNTMNTPQQRAAHSNRSGVDMGI